MSGQVPLTAAGFDGISSGSLADALDSLGATGSVASAVRALHRPRKRFAARAYTVRWSPTRKPSSIVAPQPSTWDQVSQFLAPACTSGAGLVYVAGTEDGRLVTELALAGGFSAGDFAARGFSAMVLGGAIRDAHVLRRLPLPIWGTGFMPADTQGSWRVAECGSWCNVGGRRIETGDWIFGDETGLVHLPAELAERAVQAALAIEDTESRLSECLASGMSLWSAVAGLERL